MLSKEAKKDANVDSSSKCRAQFAGCRRHIKWLLGLACTCRPISREGRGDGYLWGEAFGAGIG